ncbi:hypothetical protein Pmar_PMAR018516 [Perkinsus marinus ATCC 50983]|uniref:Uncharacterized protein n=1 Tax=Perkinsus marinus (strain ATCC 50983 / TXsc) TaxID=423536 RepID=C5L014_PERM5|nr:hypothetical protein Pmar_PMAR018516 [Perkinsus marinus ATCC 50983]EER09872.1 hypothetical protein Pmar_PMAR018516 [Perkinsus marinus ATCC 50983]|eukprot:XP_002778077.1 hypothetical protein Pmar_PMAR018516 [Perkinsus marinus ATCC 50983]
MRPPPRSGRELPRYLGTPSSLPTRNGEAAPEAISLHSGMVEEGGSERRQSFLLATQSAITRVRPRLDDFSFGSWTQVMELANDCIPQRPAQLWVSERLLHDSEQLAIASALFMGIAFAGLMVPSVDWLERSEQYAMIVAPIYVTFMSLSGLSALCSVTASYARSLAFNKVPYPMLPRFVAELKSGGYWMFFREPAFWFLTSATSLVCGLACGAALLYGLKHALVALVLFLLVLFCQAYIWIWWPRMLRSHQEEMLAEVREREFARSQRRFKTSRSSASTDMGARTFNSYRDEGLSGEFGSVMGMV